MQPANDPHTNYRALVQRSYDQIAESYEQKRHHAVYPELGWLTARLPAGATVLDVGCGSGVPIARELAAQYHVTGVDLSAEHIRRAQHNVLNGIFLHGDIMALTLPAASFDAVVAFYSIFHLPREEHHHLFERIATWLKPNGYLLATVANSAKEAYTEDDFFGATMYWSNYGLAEYRTILQRVGFQLLTTTIIGTGCADDPNTATEQHPLVFAQRQRTTRGEDR